MMQSQLPTVAQTRTGRNLMILVLRVKKTQGDQNDEILESL
jgi:hypothetical protein